MSEVNYQEKYQKYRDRYKQVKIQKSGQGLEKEEKEVDPTQQRGGGMCIMSSQCDEGETCDHRQLHHHGFGDSYGPVGRCVSKETEENSHKCVIM